MVVVKAIDPNTILGRGLLSLVASPWSRLVLDQDLPPRVVIVVIGIVGNVNHGSVLLHVYVDRSRTACVGEDVIKHFFHFIDVLFVHRC